MVEMTTEEAVNKLRYDEARLNELSKQVQALNRTFEETRMTRVTLEGLPDAEATGLIPLGSVLLPVKANATKIKINIGAGTFVEKTREETIESLKKREKNLDAALQKLQTDFSRIQSEALDIKNKLQQKMNPSDVPVING